mgnify:CR=1 FL=1
MRQVVDTLHMLYSGVEQVSAHTPTAQPSSKLLCHISLQDLYSAEQKNTTALAEFTDKRFFDVSVKYWFAHDSSITSQQ